MERAFSPSWLGWIYLGLRPRLVWGGPLALCEGMRRGESNGACAESASVLRGYGGEVGEGIPQGLKPLFFWVAGETRG